MFNVCFFNAVSTVVLIIQNYILLENGSITTIKDAKGFLFIGVKETNAEVNL